MANSMWKTCRICSVTLAGRVQGFHPSFAKEVRVKGKEAEIIYTIPLPPDGILRDKVGILPIVHASGEGGTRTPTPCGT